MSETSIEKFHRSYSLPSGPPIALSLESRSHTFKIRISFNLWIWFYVLSLNVEKLPVFSIAICSKNELFSVIHNLLNIRSHFHWCHSIVASLKLLQTTHTHTYNHTLTHARHTHRATRRVYEIRFSLSRTVVCD